MHKAKYIHDCVECRFLGHFYDRDMFFCPQPKVGPTLLLRYGDKPEEYESYPYSVHKTVMAATHVEAIEALRKGAKLASESMLLVKRLTLARLLADAEGLKEAEMIVSAHKDKR